MKTSRQCFVIGPIGDRDAHLGTKERIVYEDSIEVWERVIEPACSETGVQPIRADHIDAIGEIPEQVCRYLKEADLVIADLTGGNANVMYELGLRHTTGLPTIQIGERGRLPFDVSAIRTIMFQRTEGGLIQARRKLLAALNSLDAGEGLPVTATRIWADSVTPTTRNEAESSGDVARELPADNEELGYLEKLAEAEDAMNLLSGRLQSVNDPIVRMNEILALAGDRLNRSEAAGKISARVAIVDRAADELALVADSFGSGVVGVAEVVHAAAPGMNYLIECAEMGERLPLEFVQAVIGLGDAASSSQETIDRLVDILVGSGQATRSLRRVTSRIGSNLKRFSEVSDVLVAWRNRVATADAKLAVGGDEP